MRKEFIERLNRMQSEALAGGGDLRIRQQHEKGKLTARERIDLLLDPHSFEEIGMLVTHRNTDFDMENTLYPGDGVITGYGLVNGRLVYVFAQDFTVFGGSLSETHARKICVIMDMALQNKAPLVGLNDSGGARIQEGVDSLAGYAEVFYRNTVASGVIPQISAILGPCAGGAVYSPAITDFILMTDHTSYMFVTGPNVVKTVTNETVTSESLGGALTHAGKSGVSHLTAANDMECIEMIKKLLYYLPSHHEAPSPQYPFDLGDEYRPALDELLPDSSQLPYDIKSVIREVADHDSFFEIHELFAPNIVVGFATLGGKSIGIVANQPQVLAGVLDVNASRKAARFVRYCDSFNIPLVVLVDVPGFLPGTDQEWNGIIVHGAKLLYAFSEATVPRLTVIVRKAYGGAYDVMNSKHIGADFSFAWPGAEIAVMGARGASEIIFKKEIEASADPDAKALEKEKEYANTFLHPYRAAARGYVDEVILPSQTRRKLIKALASLSRKEVSRPSKKHGNIPL